MKDGADCNYWVVGPTASGERGGVGGGGGGGGGGGWGGGAWGPRLGPPPPPPGSATELTLRDSLPRSALH